MEIYFEDGVQVCLFGKFDFLKAQLKKKVGQLRASAFIGIFQNTAVSRGTADVLDGLLPGGLLEILIVEIFVIEGP